MDIERRTKENTAIVLIDYVSGFANMIGTQSIPDNIAGARALAQTALTFGVPLVVTLGPEDDPRGILYPEVAEVIGDHRVVYRRGSFDAFDHPGFADAITATGRTHLVVAGLMGDGCVLQSSLTALRRGYQVSLVVDATASLTDIAQQSVIHRLGALGVTMTTWLSLASELQGSYDNTATLPGFRRIQANAPGYGKFHATIANAVAHGSKSPA